MKLLMIYCEQFSYKTALKNLESAPDQEISDTVENAIVAFIQGEAEDQEREKSVTAKLLKNLKWLAGKLQTKKIVLHSFAHLSQSKADPRFVQNLFDHVQERLEHTGYEVRQTPFGYFLDLQVSAPGFSLARVFKDL